MEHSSGLSMEEVSVSVSAMSTQAKGQFSGPEPVQNKEEHEEKCSDPICLLTT